MTTIDESTTSNTSGTAATSTAESDAVRFWSKVLRDDDSMDSTSDCWLWQASGGFFSSEAGRLLSPRRYAWEQVLGELIPKDTILRATCRVKACVNPGHMALVWKGKRSDTHCSRGHEMVDENGYWAKDGTWTCRTCKRDHHRMYRKDPEFRAQQAEYSRDYARRNPDMIEEKKARARRRYAEDPDYRARALASAKKRREQLRLDSRRGS